MCRFMLSCIISIGNSMSCTSELSKISRVASASDILDNFEILRGGIIIKYQVQLMLLFVYNKMKISISSV